MSRSRSPAASPSSTASALDNVVLEIWQADAGGRFDNPGFFGWGRAATDAQGNYRFRTIRPGARAGPRAAHEFPRPLFRPDAPAADGDVLRATRTTRCLQAVEAHGAADREEGRANRYRFDIRLRGGGETPFFDD